MLLSAEVRLQLQHDRGLFVTECCDKCGKLLGPVRFTRRGDAGVWCSRECRDGVAHGSVSCRACGAPLGGKRRGAAFCSDRCRKRDSAKVLDSQIIAETHIQSKEVTGAIFESGYIPTRKPENAVIADGSGL
jgi:endogenous inhibitor of DNA gyrase (YacG/DUF329 family)